ncbi:60S ribosomal protein L22-like isoform X2 [Falco naumanni]|uniref:60S ribosomal protein L22-like isoform X2 n=1 Tax=Falco naumanni TaxID=148594 RepID=UPI001ADE2730|nr:60S ribosomal protein L22-like isoform X2 [Falco naumanni]
MRRSCSVLAAAPRCPRASQRAPAATSAHGATPGLPGPQGTRPGAARRGPAWGHRWGAAVRMCAAKVANRSAALPSARGRACALQPAALLTLPEALRATSGCAAAAGRLRERPARRGPRGCRRLRGAPAPGSGPRGRLSAGRAAAAAWRAAAPAPAPRPAAAAGGAAALVIEQLKKRAVWSQLLPKHETEFMGVRHPPNKEDGTAYPQQTWQTGPLEKSNIAVYCISQVVIYSIRT